MNKNQIIKKTEKYVQKCMASLPPNVHDYKHVDRVRKWAIKIARAEKVNPFLIEIAALLHDIGRSKENPPKILHADIGAKMAYEFLTKNKLVSKKDAEQITYAVANHSRGGKGYLVNIIQDADKMDGFGILGIIRLAQHAYKLPDYNPQDILGKTQWSKGEASKILKKQKFVGKTIIENLNFIITWYQNLHTKSARKFARPFIKYLRDGQKLLIKQINIK